jgi:hypothetical protein
LQRSGAIAGGVFLGPKTQKPCISAGFEGLMGATGFELLSKASGKQHIRSEGGAESGAVAESPADLTDLMNLWSRLSDSARSAIVTLASASFPTGSEDDDRG